jgi:hypothetical protein
MKLTKILGVMAAAVALMAFAGTASATTLETNGVKQGGAVAIDASQSGAVAFKSTAGAVLNECATSTIKGGTNVFTGVTVSGPLDDETVGGKTVVTGLTFTNCEREPIAVDMPGTFSIEAIAGTTNGTLRSNGAKLTVPSSLGTLTCTTSNTDIGTLTGTAAGVSVIHINAVLNCGFVLPTAKWEGTYNVNGHSLGVVA